MRRSASSAASAPTTPASRASAGALRGLDDQLRQPLAAAAVEPVGLRVFVDQAFELAARRPKARLSTSGGGRWPMVTRGEAALGLRGLARIVDDERIDDRQRAGDDFRKALGA